MFTFEWKLINKVIVFSKIYLVYMSLHCYNEMYVLYICICMCLCMLAMKCLTLEIGCEYNLKVILVHIRKNFLLLVIELFSKKSLSQNSDGLQFQDYYKVHDGSEFDLNVTHNLLHTCRLSSKMPPKSTR